MKAKWNKNILCIDDEESIRHAYRDILSPIDEQEVGLDLLKQEMSNLYDEESREPLSGYNLLFASSGEEAIEVARKEKVAGREIAVGFFDMRMKTKMDGVDTIDALKKIFPRMLCAVVTAYSDCSLDRIGSLFENPDEWVYFNKPFTKGELVQIAANLVASWNLRRENDAYINDLMRLINCISKMKQIAISDLKNLLEAVLQQVVRFVGSRNGFLVTIDEEHKKFSFEVGIGDYSDPDVLDTDTIKALNRVILEELKHDTIALVKNFTVLSVKAVCFDSAIVYLDLEGIDQNDKRMIELLEILVKNAASAISTAKKYNQSL